LQKEELTAVDFYLKWFKLKIALSKFDSTFAVSLLTATKERERAIIDNEMFISVIFMNPKFENSSDDSEREKAKSCFHSCGNI
jgi:hypothetical protein